MTLVDRVISSLRSRHDDLAGLVATLDDAALTGPSGASEWRVCDVLSHLGSGAEITLRPVVVAATGTEPPTDGNQAIWDRWNALSPREQASGFIERDEVLVATLEGLDDDQRRSVSIDLGFLPAPVPLEVAAGMRLSEVALHEWDVRAGVVADAVLDEEAAGTLLELHAGPMAMMLGFSSRPDAVAEPVVLAVAGHGLSIGDAVTLVAEPPVAPTATFNGPVEAFVRLLAGRLGPGHTPDDVEVVGNTTLDELRGVFPGY
ncbi:maleylpyruvate isomerase family mycothiol-dependent enzyme [Nocardioides dongxiaopingii]|uniref:maleylpyruvate isomerase family mycothiol-dependent enzyme n=1 Tax=Nocardioides dongxiaopingii TaxID=2576036 RepID=UPI0010C7640B|nr:maleylpyruvate isomerase family mycothiol-dependent enzyme [Nocardioides dongxiaopingii]